MTIEKLNLEKTNKVALYSECLEKFKGENDKERKRDMQWKIYRLIYHGVREGKIGLVNRNFIDNLLDLFDDKQKQSVNYDQWIGLVENEIEEMRENKSGMFKDDELKVINRMKKKRPMFEKHDIEDAERRQWREAKRVGGDLDDEKYKAEYL